MQRLRLPRPPGWPWRKPRPGVAADFARAMARAEFGRHYVDDKQLEEVRRSLASGKARRAAPEGADTPEASAIRKRKAKAKEER